jgi:CHAD domain-containing protein
MKHTIRRRRPLRPRPTRHQVNQEIGRARHLHELFRIEQAIELSKAQPDIAHLRYIQEQLAALDDVVMTLEAY